MLLDEMAFIVNGSFEDEPHWEQQQDCEEHQRFDEHLEELATRINRHLMKIEWTLRELHELQAVFSPKDMSKGHTPMQGGYDDEL